MSENPGGATQDVSTSIAFHNEAVTVVTAAGLASEEGVPLQLDKGNDQVLMLYSPPSCGHQGGQTVSHAGSLGKVTTQFDTNEHMSVVSGLNLQMPGRQIPALGSFLNVGPNLRLSYGQIIALGGDFYGDPNQPVCTVRGGFEAQVDQFQKNFAQLQASANEVRAILDVCNTYEYVPILKALRNNWSPSQVYASIPWTKATTMNDEDLGFDTATGGAGRTARPSADTPISP